MRGKKRAWTRRTWEEKDWVRDEAKGPLPGSLDRARFIFQSSDSGRGQILNFNANTIRPIHRILSTQPYFLFL